MRVILNLQLLLITLVINACGNSTEIEESYSNSTANYSGPIKDEIGQLFMVDHYKLAPHYGSHKIYKDWIKNYQLGGMIFWNGGDNSAIEFRTALADYAETAASADVPIPIFSLDYEHAGIQKLTARNGVTSLLKANQLGSSAKRSGDFRLCSLHGEIIGKELGSIGFNMALSTVSDIYYRGSKTSGMYRDRAVSSDSEIVADCLVAIYEGVVLTDGIIFNSKHFPGLGRASGNTDNGVVYSEATSLNEIEEDLLPFKKLIASSIELNRPFRLSLMSSHAIYPLLDPTNVFASESKEIMTSLLRDKLSFEGINVSDAMWLGPFGDKKGDALYRKFVTTLLSGIDMLMIASRDFRASYKYLNAIYYGQVPIDEQDRLLEETGYLSWEQLVQDFKYRVDESIERIVRSKADLPKSIIPSNIQPKELTKDIVQEYFDLSK